MNYWSIGTSYDRFKDFAREQCEQDDSRKGMRIIRLNNWRLLEPLLYTIVDMSHAVFRGVENNEWSLEPSIFRRIAFKDNCRNIEEKNGYIKKCFDHFKEAVRGRRGPLSRPLDQYNDYELWSLGRHFGVKNTMLDWSHSPYICLFFAFERRSKKTTRSLYCLKKKIVEECCPEIEEKEEHDITLIEKPSYNALQFYKPMSDDNARMIGQQGLFTVSRSPHNIETWVAENSDLIFKRLQTMANEHGKEEQNRAVNLGALQTHLRSGWVLLRIDIETDKDERKQILKWLNRMNINHATLYPDIEGASLYANMQGDIHHY